MRFRTDIVLAEIPGFIRRMIEVTGAEPWVKRLDWLLRESAENLYMGEWLHDRFVIELALREALLKGPAYFADMGSFNQGSYELAAFATGIVSLYDELSEKGRKRLRGQLLDGLKSDSGLLSLQLEISTIAHLIRAGYEVEAHDLESGEDFDFLASRDGQEVEVECKLVSADIGRKIHRRQSAKLFHSLTPLLETVFRSASRGLLVRIALPDRLTPGLAQHEAIVWAVKAARFSGSDQSDVCDVQLYDFEIERSPFAAGLDARERPGEVNELIARLTGRANSTLMMMASPGERALVVLLESAQPDAVLAGIRRQLRDAANDQLSGTRPGCLVAALHDLTDSQLLSLVKSDSPVRQGATGLQLMTSDLLESQSRSHVHSVVYRARSRLSGGDDSIMGQGYTYVVKNEWHPHTDDPRCRLFGSVKIPSGLILPA